MGEIEYDIIIVGGGISGLYTAYNALKKDKNRKILILEKSDRLGGRIYTDYNSLPTPIECGAGRFHSGHRYLLGLLRELGLYSKIKTINNIVESEPLKKIMNHVIHMYDLNDNKDQDLSLRDFLIKNKILTMKEYEYLESHYGYSAELIHMNVKDAMILIKDMRAHSKYYVLQDGLSQIIDKLEDKISKMGAEIKMNTNVKNIQPNQEGFLVHTTKLNQKYSTSKCVLAIPKDDLKKMPILSTVKTQLDQIVTTPLCRIYALYDKEKDGTIWFENLEKMTVTNKLRMIIPSNKEKGVIMISYTDDKYAKWWKTQYEQGGKSQVIKEITKLTRETFNKQIPRPRDIEFSYWDAGVAFWRPGTIETIKNAKDISRPFGLQCHLYICGENYSPKQQWMESALITCPKL